MRVIACPSCLVLLFVLFVGQHPCIVTCQEEQHNNNQVVESSSSSADRSLFLEGDFPIPDFLPIVTAQEALDFPIMLPVADSCEAGLSYIITSLTDLESVLSNGQIWCLFSVGLVPDKVPLGGLLVSFLTFHTTRFWVPLGFNLFQSIQGKFVIQTHCLSADHHLVGVGVGRDFPVWGVATAHQGRQPLLPDTTGTSSSTRRIGSNSLELGDEYDLSEFDDGRGGIILDFRQHTSRVCPYQPNDNLPPSPFAAPFKPMQTKEILLNTILPGAFSVLPVTQHIDLARVVGRTANGDLLYLVRSGVQDTNRPDRGIQTYMWSAWTSKDTSVVPVGSSGSGFTSGDALAPTKAFQYQQPGVFLNYYKRVLPGLPGFR
eukprot:GHVS01041335.1.p1 GENE.GHVS01041335.1~~GHVS01041335.1.p1  ORF type:complete len:374 (+),score=51.21 GHVS01041335.1:462-1583(+)